MVWGLSENKTCLQTLFPLHENDNSHFANRCCYFWMLARAHKKQVKLVNNNTSNVVKKIASICKCTFRIVCTATHRHLMIGTKTESKRMSLYSTVLYRIQCRAIRRKLNRIAASTDKAGIMLTVSRFEFISNLNTRKSCYLCKFVFDTQWNPYDTKRNRAKTN